jgi:hypothetical protein
VWWKAAGFEITDSKGTITYLRESPVVIRFKGGVPAFVLLLVFPFPTVYLAQN